MNLNSIFKRSNKSLIKESEKKITEYKGLLKELKEVDVEEVAIEMYKLLLPYYTIDYSKVIKMINQIHKIDYYGYDNFEDMLSSFGKRLDSFYNREDKMLELEMLIHEEREKIKELTVEKE